MDTRCGVVAAVDARNSTSRNVGSSVSRDGANITLVAVGTRNSVGGGNGALVRVVTDVRSMTIVSKTLLLDSSGIAANSSVARIGSVVRRTNGVVSGDRSGNNTLLDVIISGDSLGLSDEETASRSTARSVVVRWARSVSLLLLVVAHESELHKSSEEEENSSSDGDGEASLVELAGSAKVGSEVVAALSVGKRVIGRSVTKRSSDIVFAAVGALAGQNCNSNHATHAEEIEDQTKNGEEGDTSQAACQKSGADSVKSDGTGKTLNGLPSGRDIKVMVCENGKEVTEDANDDGSTAEAEEVESGLQQTEGASLEDTHDDWRINSDRRG